VRIVSEALLNEASTSGQLDEVQQIAQDHLPLDYFSTLAQRYAGITAADIQRVAKEYIEPDRLIQVYAGPEGPWSSHAL
jgi:predicted Zn-dependent peptidase